MKDENLHNLLRIGLTEGESKVYLALSEIGSSTVGPVVKKANVAYSNIYEIMNRLIEKGIVSFIIKNKTKYFQAASPRNLVEYLTKKEEKIKDQKTTLIGALPGLESIQTTKPKQEAEVFMGKKGLRTAYEKLIGNDEKDEYVFFYIHKERYARESDLFYFSVIDLVESIPARGITNELSRKSLWFQKVKKTKVKFTDSPLPGNIEVCNNRVLLVSWEETIISVLINSEDIANNYRKYFNTMWDIIKD